MMVGEVWPRDQRSLADYLRPDELQQAFNFRFLFSPWKANAFRSRIEEVESSLGAEAWPTYTLSNHDFPRHITRYGAIDAEARARMAAVLLLTMRGTPFIYYGEEIGMRECRDSRRSQTRPGRARRMPHADAVECLAQRRLHDRIGGVAAARRLPTPSMWRNSVATHPRCCRCIGG